MAWVAGADKSTGDLVSSSDWNNYLGVSGSLEWLKANKMGAFYEIAPTAWSQVTTASTWEDWDLSGSIPSGATHALVCFYNRSASTKTMGVRKNGSSVNRYVDLYSSADYECVAMCWVVELDSNRIVERYSTDNSGSDCVFTVVGYWKDP